MPWRKLITTRRHPFAWTMYAVAALSGWLYVGGVFDAQVPALAHAVGGVVWAWILIWMLAIGGLVGLVGLLIPNRWIDDALSVEMLGAALSLFGTGTLIGVIISFGGWDTTGWMGDTILAAGYGGRAIGCVIDRHHAAKLAQAARRELRES